MVSNNHKNELCIVHIGMPKTGSSTLQEAFYAGLKDKRVSTTDFGEPNQSCRLHGLFCDNPIFYHCFAHKSMSVEDVKRYRQETKNILINSFTNAKSIHVLSAEDLFHLSDSGVKKLKEFLEEYFERIIITAYVRPVKSFCESAFQQLVKNHELGSFNFNIIYHRYMNFKRYDDVFGSGNVKLLCFEPECFPDGDIVLDFCAHHALKPTTSKTKVVNESLSMEAIAILFTYHFHEKVKTDFGDRVHIINHRLVDLIRPIGNTKFKFNKELIQSVIDQRSSDYNWISARTTCFEGEKSGGGVGGIRTESELMWFATEYIDELKALIYMKSIKFELKKHPQTVAKLVDLLMNQIFFEMK